MSGRTKWAAKTSPDGANRPAALSSSSVSPQFRPVGVREAQVGNRRHTAATAETMGYARAFHRAFDWQPRGRLGSAVECPGLRRCALATRFRQWSSQRSSSQSSVGTVNWSNGCALVCPARFVRCQSIRQRPPAKGTQNNFFSGVALA
jgi:hypothetical protein